MLIFGFSRTSEQLCCHHENIQSQSRLKPGNWRDLPIFEAHNKMENAITSANEKFRDVRKKYVENILSMVLFENEDVEKKILQCRNLRKCSNPNCGKTFNTMKRVCDSCGSKVASENNSDYLLQLTLK